MHLYPEDLPESLDFGIIKKEIALYCQTPGGRELVMAIAPAPDRETLLEELTLTNELLSLYQSGESFPATLFDTILPAVQLLKTSGTTLEEKQFAFIRSLCLTYENVFRFVTGKRERWPRLHGWIQDVPPDPEIPREIDRRIDERGQVRSNASPELARIRTQLAKSRAAADRIFERILKKYREKGFIADFDESVSENRRVLAIQAGYKGQVQGIFHGSSARQSISYIEPGETVEINNEVAYLVDEEKQEIRRILRELSNIIRPKAPLLREYEERLTRLDFLKAKALFARKEGACLPVIAEERVIDLKKAYNPVLQIFNRQKGKTTIPLDLTLDGESRILVISGPNAGGKSITLKTLGLLQLMLQSGVLVPVHPGSRFCLFSRLMGDIGDSQSIENELSTYSSKLEKMKHFLQYADDETLLLIDEFGSGSDPDLGSALAQVFLEKLNRFKTYGIFTTHYNSIKAIAAATEGIRNGAMLFDRSTFTPEYRLETGSPGSSYTFEVAEKSGIAPHIIKEARERAGKNTLRVDQLLVQIQDEKLQLEKKRDRLNEELSAVKKLEAEKESTIRKLEEKLEKQSRLNEENDRVMYWGQRFQKLVESWMDQQSQKDKKATVARFIGMLNQRSSEVEKEEHTQLTKAGRKREQKIAQLISEPVKTGDRVRILESNMEGTIQEVKGERYRIAIGDVLSTVLSREKFVPASARLEPHPKKKKRKKNFGKKKEAPDKADTPPENKPGDAPQS